MLGDGQDEERRSGGGGIQELTDPKTGKKKKVRTQAEIFDVESETSVTLNELRLEDGLTPSEAIRARYFRAKASVYLGFTRDDIDELEGAQKDLDDAVKLDKKWFSNDVRFKADGGKYYAILNIEKRNVEKRLKQMVRDGKQAYFRGELDRRTKERRSGKFNGRAKGNFNTHALKM